MIALSPSASGPQTSPYIVDVTRENFQQEVLERSMQVPVLVDFWASWCEPCKQIAPVLESLVQQYNGRFVLAKVNADEEQAIARACAVRGLPTMKLFVQGQLGGELVGAQPEQNIRALIDRFAPPPPETQHDKAFRLLQGGQADAAIQLMKQAIQQEPDKDDHKSNLLDIYIALRRLPEATALVEGLGNNVNLQARLHGKLTLARVATEANDSLDGLRAKLAQAPNDPALLHVMGCVAALDGEFDVALETFWELFRSHRSFNDQAGRKALIAVLDMLGDGDPRVTQYRRKMFALLH
jgi:putative thioredoxin